jgi:hypothetical protein
VELQPSAVNGQVTHCSISRRFMRSGNKLRGVIKLRVYRRTTAVIDYLSLSCHVTTKFEAAQHNPLLDRT